MAEWGAGKPNRRNRKSQIATTEGVVRTLGQLDVSKILPIRALRLTIADIEEASMDLAAVATCSDRASH
jgi:hypothetical protein